MTNLWSQLLLAFLFVTIGFIGGVLVTYYWFERERKPDQKEKDTQPVSKGKVDPGINSQQVEKRIQAVIAPPLKVVIPKKQEQQIPAPPVVEPAAVVEQVKAAEPASMVAQIDEILQEMVIDKGISARAIRLKEDLRQGVVVWIGLDRYVGIDSVPDLEVRSIIREAVSEWEKRTEKKKNAK